MEEMTQHSFNSKMEEYCRNVPEDDQKILRKYFIEVGMTYKEIKTSRIGSVKSEEEVFLEALNKHCGHLPKRRFKKVKTVLKNAHLYSEPLFQNMLAEQNHTKFKGHIFVPGSNCHYKKEFLLERISDKLDPSTNMLCMFKTTFQDTPNSCKVINPVDFSRLEPIKIIELEPEKIHTNKVINATLIDDGFVLTAYHTVIEDIHGQCAKLCIYHITSILLKSLKKGVKIAIANPHYESGEMDGYSFIRMESPEEVIVIRDETKKNTPNQKKSSDDYKTEGNKFYKCAQYSEAIDCYTCAINGDDSNPIYISNRAQCYLKLELYEEALLDSEIATKLDANTDKHFYRLAKAWSGLGNHEKSFEILKNINTGNPDIRSAFIRESMLLNNSKGEFDFNILEKKAKEGKEDLEIGDYLGPITIGISCTHGHGVFATRDIQKGEPILVCKALAFSGNTNDMIPEPLLLEYVTMGKSSKKSTRKLIDYVTAKITQSKLSAFRVFNLSLKHQHQEHIPIELYTGRGYECVREKSRPPYQIEKIRKIVQDNEFVFSPNEYDSPSGFWPILSYFNHSCLVNSVPSFLRDICVVRASTNIREGTEINTSFLSAFGKISLEERRDALLKNWNFDCDCDLCRFESDPKNQNVLQRGIQLMNRAKKISSPEYNASGMIQRSHFKLLNQAFALAKEMNLGPTRFNASVWRAIHYLTNIKIDPKDHGKYYNVLVQARQFLCEFELEHQLFYWIKCNGLVKMYRADVPEEFKVESKRNLHQIETLAKNIDLNFTSRLRYKWSDT